MSQISARLHRKLCTECGGVTEITKPQQPYYIDYTPLIVLILMSTVLGFLLCMCLVK